MCIRDRAITCKLGEVKECLVSAEALELPEGPHLLLSMVDILSLIHI